jgi:hypothetical protein
LYIPNSLETTVATLVTSTASSAASSTVTASATALGFSWLTLGKNDFSSINFEALGCLQSLLAFFSGVEFDEAESSWSAGFSVGWDFDVSSILELRDSEEHILSGAP